MEWSFKISMRTKCIIKLFDFLSDFPKFGWRFSTIKSKPFRPQVYYHGSREPDDMISWLHDECSTKFDDRPPAVPERGWHGGAQGGKQNWNLGQRPWDFESIMPLHVMPWHTQILRWDAVNWLSDGCFLFVIGYMSNQHVPNLHNDIHNVEKWHQGN